ncbi:MAG: hypothetical protein D6755_02305 [Anaerolineae bacterium]|nr:MAG: hypothetical protein D6755_02305 [Anaerolineae bacterium]
MKFVLHVSVLFSMLFQNMVFIQRAVVPYHGHTALIENVGNKVEAPIVTDISAHSASMPEDSTVITVTPTTVVTATLNVRLLAGEKGSALMWDISGSEAAASVANGEYRLEIELPPGLTSEQVKTQSQVKREILSFAPNTTSGRISFRPEGVLVGNFYINGNNSATHTQR